MAQQTLNNGDLYVNFRTKLNENFTELYGRAEVPATWAWAALTGVPATFTPSAHDHAIADVTGLQTALDGKQATGAYLLPAAIGVTVQGYSAATVLDAGYVHTDNNFTAALLTKLNGVATGATAVSNADIRAQVEAMLVAGANITLTPAGAGATRTLTLAATGGGSSQSPILSWMI